jgi:hypothetical protein
MPEVYSVNGLRIDVLLIKAFIKVTVKIGNDTTGYRNAHSEHIDEDEQFVLHHAAPGDE